MNGDVAVPGGLTPAGVEQARALGEALRGEPLDLCVTSELERAIADGRRRARGPGRPAARRSRAQRPALRRRSRAGRSRSTGRGRARRRRRRRPAASGESRCAIVERYARAFRSCSTRPERDDPRRLPLAAGLVRARGARRRRAGRARAARRVRDAVPVHAPTSSSAAVGRARALARRARAGEADFGAWSVLERIEAHIRRHELIEPGGEVLCLVSGGADSTCLLLALRELGYRVSALHVDHGLRGDESDEDARFCAEVLGAEVVRADGARPAARPSCATSATPRRRAGCARPGTPRATRSRRSSTGSSRAATRRGSSRAARTASCGRCCRSGARRPRRSAASAASSSGSTRRTPARRAA